MIRKAVPADLENIVALGVEFGNLSKGQHTFSVSESKIRSVARQSIIDPNCIFLIFESEGITVGVALAYLLTPFFSDEIACQEMALYSRKPTGLHSLLKALEQEAKKKGAKRLVVGSKPDYCNLENFYKRQGFIFMENQFIKEV